MHALVGSLNLRKTFIVIYLVILGKANIASSQSFYPGASESMGETGRASVESIDAHFLNPAALPFAHNQYEFGSFYRSEKPTQPDPTTQFGFVAVDNSPEGAFVGGAHFLQSRRAFPDHQITDKEIGISGATYVLPKMALGAMGRRVERQDQGRSWTKHNMNVGALVVPAEWLGVGVVGYDILNDDDLDMVPQLGLGLHFNVMDVFKFKADVTRFEKKNPEKKAKLGLGLDLDAGEGFAIRTGGIWDSLINQRYWTGGIAWNGPKLCFDYAYKGNWDVAGDFAHTFDLRLVF